MKPKSASGDLLDDVRSGMQQAPDAGTLAFVRAMMCQTVAAWRGFRGWLPFPSSDP